MGYEPEARDSVAPSTESKLVKAVLSRELGSVLALGVLALSLRIASLTTSLWLDEGFSVASARRLQGFDALRPLYFLFLRWWMKLGTGAEWFLRLPSLVFGV